MLCKHLYALGRTLCGARLATVAFRVVYDGQIVFHRYCPLRTEFGAKTAAKAPVFAESADVFAFDAVFAGNIHDGGFGYPFYKMLGAHLKTLPAAYAL